MRIALVGFGGVGRGLVRILHDKCDELQADYGFAPQIVAVVTATRGTLYHPDGLALPNLLAAIEQKSLSFYPSSPGLKRDWDAERIVRELTADVLVEASPSDLRTGGPALALCYAAIDSHKHIVLANKGPVAVAYRDLKMKADSAGVLLLFEGTVMAGTPSLRLAINALAGCKISAARGIINGTTNYILTQMETGLSYGEALKQAQALGYAETDPAGDVEGWDAAGKAIILAAVLFDAQFTFDTMPVKGITHITADDIHDAQRNGERWKLIATVTPESTGVEALRLPLNDPLANVGGATNAITYSTDLLGDVTLIGTGAGSQQTGFALLSDLLEIHRAGHILHQ